MVVVVVVVVDSIQRVGFDMLAGVVVGPGSGSAAVLAEPVTV